MEGEGKSAITKEQAMVKPEPVIPTIPDDLITQMILPRLSVKPLMRFKSVSKYWLSSISSINFAKTHLKFQSSSSDTKTFIYKDKNDEYFSSGMAYGCNLSLDENYHMKEFVGLEVKYLKNDTIHLLTPRVTRVIGSSNGLLCMFDNILWEFIIWNPVTNQYHIAGKPEFHKYGPLSYAKGVGFGYISSIDDYRIGFLVIHKGCVCFVNVYSLKTGEWKETTHVKKGGRLSIHHHAYSVLVDDTLYWSPLLGFHIVGLNLVSGDLNIIPLAKNFLAKYDDAKVFEVKGCLTLCCVKYNTSFSRNVSLSKCTSDVYTFKMNGDGCYSREKWFSIDVEGLTIVYIFETGICLVTRKLNQLLVFDPSQAKSRPSIDEYEVLVSWDRHASNLNQRNVVADVWKYTESLISPSQLCARVVNEADGDGDGDGDETGKVVEESG